MRFEKQTYTQTPNSLFVMMKDMDECELKVVLLICRYTFGYHRDEVKLSTRRIAEEIGMNTASVDKGADAAVKRGLIERIVDGNKTTIWRALVSDSEIESPVIQKLNRDDSEIESLSGVKESINKNKQIGADAPGLLPEPRPTKKLGDLVDGHVELSLSPGIKRQIRIDSILSALAESLHVRTTGKKWEEFAKLVDDRQQNYGEDLRVFLDWLTSQKGYAPQFWPPDRMGQFWPQAFVSQEREPTRPEHQPFNFEDD